MPSGNTIRLPAGFTLDANVDETVPEINLPAGFTLDIEQPETPAPMATGTGGITREQVMGGPGFTQQEPMSMPRAYALNAADALTFGFGDEMAGGINALVEKVKGSPRSWGNLYDEARDEVRATLDRAWEERPNTSMAGAVSGGLVPMALGPAQMVARAPSLASAMGRGFLTGAGYGAVEGFGSGEGGVENRLANAGAGFLTGGAIGTAAAPLAAGAGRAYQAIRNTLATRQPAGEFGVPQGSIERVSRAVRDDTDLGQLQQQPHPEDMLLNMGTELRSQADALASMPGGARARIVRDIVAQRKAESARVEDAVNRTMGPDAGRVANRKMIERELAGSGPLFEVAKQYPGTFKVDGVKNRLDFEIKTSEQPIEGVLKRIRNMKLFQGERVNAVQLHNARMAIDDMLEDMKLPGSQTSAGRHARAKVEAVRRQLDALLKVVPGWRQADEVFSTAKNRNEAIDEGRKVFTRQFGAPDELEEELSGMKPAVRDGFRRGARDAISVMMGTSRNDAAKVKDELLLKGWNDKKLQILLGKQDADELRTFLEGMERRQNDARSILANSATAGRTAGQKEFPNPVDEKGANVDLGQRNLTGITLELARRGWKGLTRGSAQNQAERINRGAAELLTATGARRDRIVQAINEVNRRRAQGEISNEQARAAVNAILLSTVPVAGGAVSDALGGAR